MLSPRESSLNLCTVQMRTVGKENDVSDVQEKTLRAKLIDNCVACVVLKIYALTYLVIS